jgi:hypothetical protein
MASILNSSIVPLQANGKFSGTYERIRNNIESVSVVIKSDKPGTLKIIFTDSPQYPALFTHTFSYDPNNDFNKVVSKKGVFVKIVYDNGEQAQTEFQLKTYYKTDFEVEQENGVNLVYITNDNLATKLNQETANSYLSNIKTSVEGTLDTNVTNQLTNYALETTQSGINSKIFKCDTDNISGSVTVNTISGFNLQSTQLEIKDLQTPLKVQSSSYELSAQTTLAPGQVVPFTSPPTTLPQEGWYYKNTATSQPSFLYYYSYLNPALQVPPNQKAYTLADVTSGFAVVKLISLATNGTPYLGIYTRPTGSGDAQPGFYKSRKVYTIPNNANLSQGMSIMIYWGIEPDIKLHPNIARIPMTLAITTGTALPTEQLAYLTFSSDSAATAGAVEYVLYNTGFVASGIYHDNEFNCPNETQPISGVISISSGSVNIGNFPSSQVITGSIEISNFPITQAISGSIDIGNFPSSQVITGIIEIANFPITQAISGSIDIGNQPAFTFNESGALIVSSSGGGISSDVNVLNFPVTQAISGSIDIGNFPSSQVITGSVEISNFPITQAISGSIDIGNFPSSQVITGSVEIANLPITQAVSVGNSYLDTHIYGIHNSSYIPIKVSASGHLLANASVQSGAGDDITSTLISTKRGLDVNVINNTDPATQTTLASVLTDTRAIKTSSNSLAATILNNCVKTSLHDQAGNAITSVSNGLRQAVHVGVTDTLGAQVLAISNRLGVDALLKTGSGALSSTSSYLDVQVKNFPTTTDITASGTNLTATSSALNVSVQNASLTTSVSNFPSVYKTILPTSTLGSKGNLVNGTTFNATLPSSALDCSSFTRSIISYQDTLLASTATILIEASIDGGSTYSYIGRLIPIKYFGSSYSHRNASAIIDLGPFNAVRILNDSPDNLTNCSASIFSYGQT